VAPIEVPQEHPVQAPVQMRAVPVQRPRPAVKRTPPPMEPVFTTPQQTDETLLEAAPELPADNR
jgi:hypothetical protein